MTAIACAPSIRLLRERQEHDRPGRDPSPPGAGNAQGAYGVRRVAGDGHRLGASVGLGGPHPDQFAQGAAAFGVLDRLDLGVAVALRRRGTTDLRSPGEGQLHTVWVVRRHRVRRLPPLECQRQFEDRGVDAGVFPEILASNHPLVGGDSGQRT